MVANHSCLRWAHGVCLSCFALLLAGCPTTPGTPTGELTISLPGGGEQWPQGTMQEIRWTPRDGGGTVVSIALRRGSTPAGSIAVDVPNSGSYTWAIAPDRQPASDYRVVVSDDLGEAESAPFSILQAEPRFATSETAHTYGPAETVWSFDVWNAGTPGTQLQFQVTANRNWIAFDPPSGTSTGPDDPVTVTVTLLPSQLGGGNNSGAVSLTSSDAPTRTVNIFANRPLPAIGLDPVDVYDFGFLGTTWSLDVWNAGETGSTLNFTAFTDKAWASVSPGMGSSADETDRVSLAVTVDRSILPSGNSSATLSIVDGRGNSKTVRLTATRPAPRLAVSSTTHDFGTTSSSWSFEVWNNGDPGSILSGQLFANQDWVGFDPPTFVSTGPDDRKTILVTVNRPLLNPGDNSANLTLSGEGVNSQGISLAARGAIPAVGVSGKTFAFGRTQNSWQFDVFNAGETNSTLVFAATSDVPWATVAPASGSSASEDDTVPVTVTLDRSLLATGNNSGNITVRGDGAGEQRIAITAIRPQPAVAVSAPTFDFGTTATTWSFDVWNAGDTASTLRFQVAPDMEWVSVSPESGTSTGPDDRQTIAVVVDRSKLPAGSSNARLTVSSESGGSTQVTLSARRGTPAVAVSAKTFDFGAGETAWTFDVWNSGETGSSLDYTVFTDREWLDVAPQSGTSTSATDRQTIAVTINRALLAQGNNSGRITVSSEDGGTEQINITAVRPEPGIAVSATAFDFGTATDTWTFEVWNNGDALSTLAFQAFADKAWLTVDPASGVSTSETDRRTVTVTLDRSALAAGNNAGRVTVLSEEAGERVINITATRPSPRIAVSATAFDFGRTGTTWGFDVWNAGDPGTTLNYAVSADKSWVSIAPETGTSASVSDRARITVTLDRATMPAGNNTARLTLTGNDGANPVTVNLTASTPAPAITVSGDQFNAGTTEDEVAFEVWNSGDPDTTLAFTASSDQPWAIPAPGSGTSTGPDDRVGITVSLNRSLVTEDSASARISLSAPGVTSKVVTINIARPRPQIAISSNTFNFGATLSTYEFEVWNVNEEGSTLTFTAAPDKEWITVTPTGGTSTEPADRQTLTVTIDRSMLPAGNSSGRVNLTSLRGGNAQFGLNVEVPSPAIATSVADHDFGKFETTWTFEVWNSGPAGTTLNFELVPKATWISVSPMSGTSTGIDDRTSVTVTVDRSLLTGTGGSNRVEISGPGVATRSVNIVAAQPLPAISTSTTGYTFPVGSSAWTFDVWNGGDPDTTLEFLVTKNQDWITVTPTQGTSDDENDPVSVSVTVDRAAIPVGEQNGVVTLVDQYNKTRNVSIAVEKPRPVIQTSADNHDFGPVSTSWSFDVWNAGDDDTTLDFFVAVDQVWLSVTPEAGTSADPTDRQTVSVNVDRGLLPVGATKGTVLITAAGITTEVKIAINISQSKAIFVDAGQTDTGADGSSWEKAFASLAEAVAAAAERHVQEVWLRGGNYHTDTLELPAGLTIVGGFEGGDEVHTVVQGLDPEAPLLLIHGDTTLDALALSGARPAMVLINGALNLRDVVIADNSGERGAALEAATGSHVFLQDCLIERNHGLTEEAAHIWLEGATLEARGTRIVEHGLTAISRDEASEVSLDDVEVVDTP